MTAHIYTNSFAEVERYAAIALERAIYGYLFVPNCSRYREPGQLYGVNQAKELLRLNP